MQKHCLTCKCKEETDKSARRKRNALNVIPCRKCYGTSNNDKCKGKVKLHTCPLQVDMNDDSETLCDCCDDQQHGCASDV